MCWGALTLAAMPTRELLAESQQVHFTEFTAPLDNRTLARFYTLSDTDLELIRRDRRASTQLGFAVQLGYARLPGRVLRVGEEAHPQIVATLASQLGVDPAVFAAYLHGRDTTRREHLLELQRDFGFRSFSATIYRELAGWLLPIALSTDVGLVLVGALVDELRERKVLAPALSTIERLAWETRRRAERLVFVRLTATLTDTQRAQLGALLGVPPGARMTTLAVLRQPPRRPTPATFVALAERLQTIRAIGLNAGVARRVHQTRLVRLAREGARYTPQFLQRFSPERRYAMLVAFLLETSASLTDEAIEAILPWPAFVNRVAEAEQLARPARFDPLTLLATAFPRLRRYAPTLLDSFQFNGTSACQPVLDGLTLLKELNTSERLKRVPLDAPIEFASPRWEPHVVSVTGAIDRAFYELCALSTLRDRLRAGDVWVAGSCQYRAFDEYLLPQPAWRELRQTQPVPVAVETTCETYLEQRRDEIHQAMTKVAGLWPTTNSPMCDCAMGVWRSLRCEQPCRSKRRSLAVAPTSYCAGSGSPTCWSSRRDDGHEPALYPSANRRAGQGSSSAVYGAAGGGDQSGPGQDGPGLPRIYLPPAGLDRRLVYTRRDVPPGAGVHHQRPASAPVRFVLGRRQHVVIGRPTVPGRWAECVDWPGQPPLRARAWCEAVHPSFRPVRSVSQDLRGGHRPLADRRGQTQQFLPLALDLPDVDAVADQWLQCGIGRGLLKRVQTFVGKIANAGRVSKAAQAGLLPPSERVGLGLTRDRPHRPDVVHA
jgi:TnpA family transposase